MAPQPTLTTRDRPSGILTKSDREFLRSDGDYYEGDNARQNRYRRRRDICERIMHSFLDFGFINRYLEGELRNKLFSDPEKYGAESSREFNVALQSIIYWLYYGCRKNESDFESILKNSVARAEKNYRLEETGDIVDVNLTFEMEITERDEGIEQFARRLMEGEPVDTDDIYRIPTLSRFPIDPEEVDVVRILPSSTHIASEKEIVKTIFREHLDIEVDVEIEGMLAATDSMEVGVDAEKDTVVVPLEEYNPSKEPISR